MLYHNYKHIISVIIAERKWKHNSIKNNILKMKHICIFVMNKCRGTHIIQGEVSLIQTTFEVTVKHGFSSNIISEIRCKQHCLTCNHMSKMKYYKTNQYSVF